MRERIAQQFEQEQSQVRSEAQLASIAAEIAEWAAAQEWKSFVQDGPSAYSPSTLHATIQLGRA